MKTKVQTITNRSGSKDLQIPKMQHSYDGVELEVADDWNTALSIIQVLVVAMYILATISIMMHSITTIVAGHCVPTIRLIGIPIRHLHIVALSDSKGLIPGETLILNSHW